MTVPHAQYITSMLKELHSENEMVQHAKYITVLP